MIRSIFATCVAVAAVHSSAAAQARNVRIATYNVQQKDDIANQDGHFYDPYGGGLTDLDRAAVIAENIRASDFEIVALQEVFDEDSRATFVSLLDKDYPYHVDYIRHGPDLQDSGLMLFSVHPFEQMDLDSQDNYAPFFGAEDESQVNNLSDTFLGWVNGDSKYAESNEGYVGFTRFTCDSSYAYEPVWDQPDCYSSKGAGLVKVGLPMGESLYVVFSHFVANYVYDNQDEICAKRADRAKAFDQIDKLLRDATPDVNNQLNTMDPFSHNIVLIGDLNIDGNPYTPPADTCDTGQWDYFFNPSGYGPIPLRCGDKDLGWCQDRGAYLVDAWAFDTSPDDLGRTNGLSFYTDLSDPERFDQGHRLDYIAYRGTSRSAQPSLHINQLIPQHLTTPWDLSGVGGRLSDHLPAAVDLLLVPDDTPLTRETPRRAGYNFVGLGQTITESLAITVPGQMQWTILDGEPGTYNVVTTSGVPTAAEVYAPYDLTRPLEPRIDEGPDRRIYKLDNPPYYVRTFVGTNKDGQNRNATTPYTLILDRFDCQSPAEACILLAGDDNGEIAIWPNKPLAFNESLFFRVTVDSADDAQPVEHDFSVTAEFTPVPLPEFTFAFRTLGNLPLPNPTVAEGGPNFLTWDNLTDFAAQGIRLRAIKGELRPASHQDVLLRVSRPDPTFVGLTRVAHRTDLTYFHPLTISVIEEEDSTTWYDELYLALELGPKLGDVVTASNVSDHTSHFDPLPTIDATTDGGAPWPAYFWLPRYRYQEELSLLILESDLDNIEDADESIVGEQAVRLANAYDNNALSDLGGQHVKTLPDNQVSRWLTWRWSDTGEPVQDTSDAEYLYEMEFVLSHVPPCLRWAGLPGCPEPKK